MTDDVMRLISLVACTATMSLFSTIVAFAAVNVAGLRSNGLQCVPGLLCGASMLAQHNGMRVINQDPLPRMAALAAKAS